MIFDNPRTDAAYDRYMDPPDIKELIIPPVKNAALQPMIEFKFTQQDYEDAYEWAVENGLEYHGDTTHLMLDWSGLNTRIKWKEL